MASIFGLTKPVLAADSATTLGDTLSALHAISERTYLICVEELDHQNDHGRFLRRSVTPIGSLSPAPAFDAFIGWLAANGIEHRTYGSVVLVVDDDLTSLPDNPMDVQVPKLEIEARTDKILVEIAKISGVGILTGARAGRFGPSNRRVRFTTEKSQKLREIMVKLAEQEHLEWKVEVTPVSHTVQSSDPNTVLLSSQKGFVICDFVN